jgi:hypothetical protein
MQIAMMWSYAEIKKEEYDLPKEIRKAWEYYSKKYGSKPDTCYVSIAAEVESVLDFDGTKVNIRHDRLIMPKCLWIGNEETKEMPIV